MKERAEKNRKLSKWEKERKVFFEERDLWKEGIAWKREEGMMEFSIIDRKEKERQRKERWEKIRDSRHNTWYKQIKEEGIPEYLRKGWTESRWNRVARFRLGNEMREGRYWEGEEKRKCRVCGGRKKNPGIMCWKDVGEKKEWKERTGGREW